MKHTTAIHAAIAAALGVDPARIGRETRVFADVSAEPVSLQAVLGKLEECFQIDFTLSEAACLHGSDGLTVGELADVVGEAIQRAAASLDDAVSRAEEAFA